MARREPWRTEPERLRRVFESSLRNLWKTWDEYVGKGSPFEDLHWIHDVGLSLEAAETTIWESGWLRGVSEATGWSLDNPSRKSWKPPKE